MTAQLITADELAELSKEATNAHRFWTGDVGWVERFDRDFLVSHPNHTEGREIAACVPGWAESLGLGADRVFLRQLVRQPGESDLPVLVSGAAAQDLKSVVLERGLRYGIDFGAGYSAGLFCDQRANRAFLESLKPRRVLNCFAYTCAFSVAAARAGAETLSVDLSKRSLERGRENLRLNGFESGEHRIIADDVLSILPRLARRGEEFDVVILDPPTFSRGAKGRVFRVERDLPDLLDHARSVLAPSGRVLLSTNASEVDVRALDKMGRAAGMAVTLVPPPPEYPPGSAAATVWLG